MEETQREEAEVEEDFKGALAIIKVEDEAEAEEDHSLGMVVT